MSVSKRLRYEILKRDNHACRYCGQMAPDVALTVDHVTPVALGGSDAPDNLVAACKDCNAGKSSTTPDATLVSDVSQDALRWARAVKAAAESLAEIDVENRQRNVPFREAWARYDKDLVFLPNDWKSSVDSWLNAGLPMETLIECMDIAMGNQSVTYPNVFAYCGGIARRKIENIHELARKLVEAEVIADGS